MVGSGVERNDLDQQLLFHTSRLEIGAHRDAAIFATYCIVEG